MKIRLDENDLDIQIEDEKTLSEVLGKIEAEISKYDATLIEVSLDGKSVKMNDFDKILQTPIEKVGNVDLVSISADELLALLHEVSPSLSALCEKLSAMSVNFQMNDKEKIADALNDLSQNLQTLFDIFSYTTLFPMRFESKKIGGKSISEFSKELSEFMNQFLDAYTNEDFVLVGDLAEYEIVPRLKDVASSF